MLFLLSLFGGRLVQVQGFDASALAAEALENRTHTEPLYAHRGDIVDARGAVLATTIELRDIRVDQTLVGEYRRRVGDDRVLVGVRGAAEDLAPLLGVSVDTLTTQLTGTNRGATIARGVRPDVAREVLRLAVPGLYAWQASRRVYDNGPVAANVLGFLDHDKKARGGVEEALDGSLTGKDGELVYEKSLDGATIPTGVISETDPRDGCRVQLTIDRDLQWKAQQLLSAQVKATRSKHGYAVVLDARTFAVRALATVPTFDPNHPERATQDTINDRGMLDTFEPGSTAKVITLAAALEEKKVTPATPFTVPPFLKRSDRSFRDSEPHGTEPLTLAGVLAQSSNIGTILAGERLTPEALARYLRLFGLGTRTGVGLPESEGLLSDWRSWSGSQRYTVMFGQGLSVTALQAAGVFATLANDGVRLRPQLVAGTTCSDGVFRPAPASQPLQVVSPDTARTMRLMMEQVVGEHGTAVKAAIPGYRVAGKTGTAQVPGKGGYEPGSYIASFIGMAPADDPAFVVAVVLDRPSKGSPYGGQIAAPVFRDLTAWALRQGKVPPTGTTTPRIPLRWN
jgi:cell division protein FtsI (penicillin-binding protein 3)